MKVEATFGMIKGGPIQRRQTGAICEAIKYAGLTIRSTSGPATAHLLQQLYREHEGRPYYAGLMESVSGAGNLPMLIVGPDAIAALRRLAGPTDPVRARETAPLSIRAVFGLEMPDNAIHGSDGAASAERELDLFFPGVRHALVAELAQRERRLGGHPASDDSPAAVALRLMLDAADYERGACRLTEMVSAVLPREVLSRARAAAGMP